MGIRPGVSILVGVDNIKKRDPRHIKHLSLDTVYALDTVYWKSENEDYDDAIQEPYQGRHITDLIYNPCNTDEYHIPEVTGLFLSHVYDEDIFRAFAVIYKRLQRKGVLRIPTYKKEDHQLLFKSYRYDDRDVECNRFVDGMFENIPSLARDNWARTRHYLLQLGWDIPETDLRYLLVWDWS
jgi:hypothetical protein